MLLGVKVAVMIPCHIPRGCPFSKALAQFTHQGASLLQLYLTFQPLVHGRSRNLGHWDLPDTGNSS